MKRNHIFALAVLLVSLVIYTCTLCPTIYWQDSSAFAAASYTLGIPFSPGFPIYILLGKIFTLLPASNPAWALNFMSALWGSLSLAILYLVLIRVFRKDSTVNLSLGQSIITAAFLLFFGFTLSFWSQTFRAEVYTLNFLFTVLLIFLLWKWSENREVQPAKSWRYFALFAFLWGLSAANHSLLVVSLAPAFLLYILLVDRRFLSRPLNLISSFFFGILGVCSYLFLLIRSQQNPVFNWGNPSTWENLWKVISKSDTWQNSFNSANSDIWVNLVQILSFLVSDIWLPVFILALVGWVVLAHRQKKFNYFLAAMLLCNLAVVAWAADFSVRNLDLLGYLLPSLMVLTFWSAAGAAWLIDFLAHRSRTFQPAPITFALAVILLALPIWQVKRNYAQADHHQHRHAYNFGKQILDSVPENAVILATEDNTLLPLWYLTQVERYRSDVLPLAWTALDVSDYVQSVKRQRPNLIFPSAVSKSHWLETFHQLNPDYPVYTQYVNFKPQVDSQLIPHGFLLKYSLDSADFHPDNFNRQVVFLDDLYEKLKARPELDLVTREHFGDFFFNTGVYYDRHSFGDQGVLNFLRALRLDQSNDRYYTALGKAFMKSGRLVEAGKFFSAAIELNPYKKENYQLLSRVADLQSKLNP